MLLRILEMPSAENTKVGINSYQTYGLKMKDCSKYKQLPCNYPFY